MRHRLLLWWSTLGLLAVAAVPAFTVPGPLLVDNFERHDIRNVLGNPANIFVKGPSDISATRRWIPPQAGRGQEVLMLRYVKRAQGGPENAGGWCGYYTLLKTPGRGGAADRYFDGLAYKKVTFWVRGQRGGENFVVGLVDRYWDKAGDSARSLGIGAYLPAGRVTTEWQKAAIPLSEFLVDFRELSAIVFMFEGDLYPSGQQAGAVYIDNVALE